MRSYRHLPPVNVNTRHPPPSRAFWGETSSGRKGTHCTTLPISLCLTRHQLLRPPPHPSRLVGLPALTTATRRVPSCYRSGPSLNSCVVIIGTALRSFSPADAFSAPLPPLTQRTALSRCESLDMRSDGYEQADEDDRILPVRRQNTS